METQQSFFSDEHENQLKTMTGLPPKSPLLDLPNPMMRHRSNGPSKAANLVKKSRSLKENGVRN